MPGSETKDIYLENQTTSETMGLMLVKNPETQSKTYMKVLSEKKLPAQNVTGVQAGETPKGRLLRWIMDSYHAGTGFKTYVTQRHLKRTDKVDLRSFGRAYVLPDEYQTNLSVGASDEPVAWVMWDSKVFHANGNDFYEASAGGQTWTAKGTTTNGDIASMVPAGVVLLLADGKLWGWNGSSLTQYASIDADGIWAVNSMYVRSNDNELSRCPMSQSPLALANWTDWVAVGEADKPIKHVINFNGGTFVCKADGIYKLQEDGDVIKIWDSYGVAYESCDYAINWNGNLVFDVGINGLFLITPAEEVIDVSLQAWCDMEHHDIVSIHGLAPMGDYLLAVIKGSWDAAYPTTQYSLWIGWQTREGGQSVFRWQELLSDIEGGVPHWYNDRIFFKNTSDYVAYIDWLMFPHRLERAADRTYGTDGVLETSNFNAGYPNVTKIWTKLSAYLPTAIANGCNLKIEIQDESGATSNYTICDIATGGGAGSELLEWEFTTPFEAAEVSLKVTLTGPTSNGNRPFELGPMTLEGYLKPDEEYVFDMELMCQDYVGYRGYEYSDFVFGLSGEANFVLTDPNGTEYNVRMDVDMPQEVIRNDEAGLIQTVVRMRCRGTAV